MFKKFILGLVLLVLLLVSVYFILDVDFEQPPLDLSGTFTSDATDDNSTTLTFSEMPLGYIGQGTIDDRDVVISGLTTPRIEGLLIDSIRQPLHVSVELALDDNTVTIFGLEDPITLRRDDEGRAPADPGALSGHYEGGTINEPIGFLDVVQDGALLVGSGNLLGQPVNVAGIVSNDDSIKGIISFEGAIESIFDAEVSGNTLTILGLGDPIILERG